MKKLFRRLSRVVVSSHYCRLRSEETHDQSPSGSANKPPESMKSSVKSRRSKVRSAGAVPVCVGEEMERFVVSAELLNHPIFVGLLKKSAQEYGYDQKGALRIPCHVLVFERILEALSVGGNDQDLLNSFSDAIL